MGGDKQMQFLNCTKMMPWAGFRNEWAIAEFFIMRKYRRQGIGKAAGFYIP